MTAPLPSPRWSPTAGLFNALVQLAIRLLDLRTVELEAGLAIVTDLNQRLTNDHTQGDPSDRQRLRAHDERGRDERGRDRRVRP